MTNNNDTAMISLTNAHGLFKVEVRVLNRALEATKYRSDELLRLQASGHCGFNLDEDCTFDALLRGDLKTPLDDLSRLEVLIAWIESGNHTF